MKSDVEIKRLSEGNYHEWQELVEHSPQGTLYHDINWLKMAEKCTNTELLLLLMLRNEVIGGIPLFCQRKYRNLLTVLMSPPYPSLTFIPSLGPVLADYDELKQHKRESRLRDFHAALERHIRSRIKPDAIRIYTTVNLVDTRPFQWSGYIVTPEYTYIGDIKNGESVWKGFKREARKSIVKAERMGIEVEENGLEGYNFVLQSLLYRFKEQGIGFNVPRQYLLDLFQVFHPCNMKVFVAKRNGVNVGGQVVTIYKDKVSFWIGGVRSSLRGVYPLDILMWKIIEWANDHGFQYCENVGANTPSISTFKSRYGFDLKPYYVIKRSTLKYRIVKTALTAARNAKASVHAWKRSILRTHKRA